MDQKKETYKMLKHKKNQKIKTVPIITLDALSKSYLVLGWRRGWLLLKDHEEALSKVLEEMHRLCYKGVGAASVIEGALPDILKNTPQSFFDELNKRLAKNANLFYNLLMKVPGLTPIMPQAAVYMSTEHPVGLLSSF